MMVPAAGARFWGSEVWTLALIGTGIGFASGSLGLFASYHLGLPSGPAIVLTASTIYLVSVLFGPQGGMLWHTRHARHLET